MRLQLTSGCASDAVPEAKEELTQPVISGKRKCQHNRIKYKHQRMWKPDRGQENQVAIGDKGGRGAGFFFYGAVGLHLYLA